MDCSSQCACDDEFTQNLLFAFAFVVERGLFTGRISNISNISKCPRISRRWSDSPLFSRVWGFSRNSRISKFSRLSRRWTFLKTPFSKRPLSKRPLCPNPKSNCFKKQIPSLREAFFVTMVLSHPGSEPIAFSLLSCCLHEHCPLVAPQGIEERPRKRRAHQPHVVAKTPWANLLSMAEVGTI